MVHYKPQAAPYHVCPHTHTQHQASLPPADSGSLTSSTLKVYASWFILQQDESIQTFCLWPAHQCPPPWCTLYIITIKLLTPLSSDFESMANMWLIPSHACPALLLPSRSQMFLLSEFSGEFYLVFLEGRFKCSSMGTSSLTLLEKRLYKYNCVWFYFISHCLLN